MNRRSVLWGAVVAPVAISAGCLDSEFLFSGENKTLEIQNNNAETVTLHISIKDGEAPPERREVVFNEAVEIPANQTVTRDVLGTNQYYITVETESESHEFGTRPICESAFTRIIVTEDGELTSQIQDCNLGGG